MKESEPKMVYVLPNLMTAGNLFCGFMAVLQILEGTIQRTTDTQGWWYHYQFSLYCILGAFLFDMLDGRLARLGGQESPFGREFDSLADVISFGIAPALLVYKIVLSELLIRAGWIIAFIYLLCGAMRLARFNVLAASPEKYSMKEFTGFPIPAAAGLIASLTLLLLHVYKDEGQIGPWKYLLAAMMLFLSYMMFSKFRYPSFKALDWRARKSIPGVLLLAIAAGLIVLYYRYSLAVIFSIYLIYGFVRPYLSKARRSDLYEEEEEEPPQA